MILSKEKLAATNKLWNQMGFNRAWMVGRTSSLIQNATFKSKEEWKQYYFSTGERRLKKLEKINKKDRIVLKSFDIEDSFKCSSKRINQINVNYGRTRIELNHYADVLYGCIIATGNSLKITRAECRYLVLYRVIGETWNGMIREVNTMDVLKETFGQEYSFEKTSGKKDVIYEVDIEVFHKRKLVCGLQVKPQSYRGYFNGKEEVLALNKEKNDLYTKEKNVPVIYVYSKVNGEIINKEVIKEIENFTSQSSI